MNPRYLLFIVLYFSVRVNCINNERNLSGVKDANNTAPPTNAPKPDAESVARTAGKTNKKTINEKIVVKTTKTASTSKKASTKKASTRATVTTHNVSFTTAKTTLDATTSTRAATTSAKSTRTSTNHATTSTHSATTRAVAAARATVYGSNSNTGIGSVLGFGVGSQGGGYIQTGSGY